MVQDETMHDEVTAAPDAALLSQLALELLENVRSQAGQEAHGMPVEGLDSGIFPAFLFSDEDEDDDGMDDDDFDDMDDDFEDDDDFDDDDEDFEDEDFDYEEDVDYDDFDE